MGLVSRIYTAVPVSYPRKKKRSKPSSFKNKSKKIEKKERTQLKKEFREDLIKRATPAEEAFKAILLSLKVQFVFQKALNQGKTFRFIDFWLPVVNIAIEIDGGYHNDQVQKYKDAERTATILRRNKNVVRKIIRFSNEQVLNAPEQVRARLKRELTFYEDTST